MAVLSDSKIIQEISKGFITIDPFDVKNINPTSYDLTLGNYLKVYDDYTLDPKKKLSTSIIEIPEEGLLLLPGELYLGFTNEIAGSKIYQPFVEGKSSIGRLGICVHITAGFGDPGFINNWTLEITVVKRVIVYPNMKICQIAFNTVEGKIMYPYNTLITSKYNDDNKAMESLYHLNYPEHERK